MDISKRIMPGRLQIKEFRNFKNISFDLGKKITIISGQNGVGKSNLLSLIASGSGLAKKSMFGSNFQPEFYDFFYIDENEGFETYLLHLTYTENDGSLALVKRLSFKNDVKSARGIRVIPRTTNIGTDIASMKEAADLAKNKYDVGGSARVKIPTIYLSLSRLYPLGECKDKIRITKMRDCDYLYKIEADKKYREWYNYVMPYSIKENACISKIEKNTCSRASLYMDMNYAHTLSQSIGQDNLGNIISALIDIYMLSLEDDYNGALLCIDEIDVSLHPDVQVKLLDLFAELADKYSIQFVLSTHSLTILEEMLKKEDKDDTNFKVVYLKTPSAPCVTEQKSFEILKADMFGKMKYNKPIVKFYFEDNVGCFLFELLRKTLGGLLHSIEMGEENKAFRNIPRDWEIIKRKISDFKPLFISLERINKVPTHLGCEELIKVNEADIYFKRVVFILDGDARYKELSQKPKIREFLDKKYNPKDFKLSDRNHKNNVCFFPSYFAPESFIYKIIYVACTNIIEYADFWRMLDSDEHTALYTPEKIRRMFESVPEDFTNDDLKKVFSDSLNSDVWQFVSLSDILSYYYADCNNINELLTFFENIKKAYDMAWPLTVSNRYS